MNEKVKEFLKRIASSEYIPEDELVKTADDLLKEEKREEIINIFDYKLVNEDFCKALKNNDKVSFVAECAYSTEGSKYLRNNFDDLDFIMEVLKEKLAKR